LTIPQRNARYSVTAFGRNSAPQLPFARTWWFLMRALVTRHSLWLFVMVSAVLIAIKLLFELYPGEYPIRSQAAAFGWPLVAAIILIGFCGLLADHAAGLPEPFAAKERDKRGLWLSIVAGLSTASSPLACTSGIP
jgi:hypothetical protein